MVKPARFDYHAPDSLEEALNLLDEYGSDASILAGGQSLMPLMNMRFIEKQAIIDINGLSELDYIRSGEEQLRIGARVRQFQVEGSPEVERLAPLMHQSMPLVGHEAIRSRGTIAGSLAHADPSAELPAVWVTLGGSLTLSSVDGDRSVPADDFFITYLTTDVEPNEMVTEVQLPVRSERTGYAIEEFTRRHGDFAIVLTAAEVAVEPDGAVAEATLSVGGVEGSPVKMPEVTDGLIGSTPTEENLQSACEEISELVNPESDIHASAEYRQDLSVTLSKRALNRAYERACESLTTP